MHAVHGAAVGQHVLGCAVRPTGCIRRPPCGAPSGRASVGASSPPPRSDPHQAARRVDRGQRSSGVLRSPSERPCTGRPRDNRSTGRARSEATRCGHRSGPTRSCPSAFATHSSRPATGEALGGADSERAVPYEPARGRSRAGTGRARSTPAGRAQSAAVAVGQRTGRAAAQGHRRSCPASERPASGGTARAPAATRLGSGARANRKQ